MDKILAEITNEKDVGVIIWRWGKLVYTNDYIFDLLGYTREELNDISIIQKIYYPDDYESIVEAQANLLNGSAKEEKSKFRFVSKEKQVYEADTTLTVRKGSQNIDFIIFQLENIKELDIKSQGGSLDSFHHILSDFDISKDEGILIAEVSSGSFVYANEIFKKALGYSMEELGKLSGSDIINSDDMKRVRKNAIKVYFGFSDSGLSVHYNCKDKKVVKVQQSVIKYKDKISKKLYFVTVYSNFQPVDAALV